MVVVEYWERRWVVAAIGGLVAVGCGAGTGSGPAHGARGDGAAEGAAAVRPQEEEGEELRVDEAFWGRCQKVELPAGEIGVKLRCEDLTLEFLEHAGHGNGQFSEAMQKRLMNMVREEEIPGALVSHRAVELSAAGEGVMAEVVKSRGEDGAARETLLAMRRQGPGLRAAMCTADDGTIGRCGPLVVAVLREAIPAEVAPAEAWTIGGSSPRAPVFAGRPLQTPEGCEVRGTTGRIIFCEGRGQLSWFEGEEGARVPEARQRYLTQVWDMLGAQNLTPGEPVATECWIEDVEARCEEHTYRGGGMRLLVALAEVRGRDVAVVCAWAGEAQGAGAQEEVVVAPCDQVIRRSAPAVE